jgi:hypothetical protein
VFLLPNELAHQITILLDRKGVSSPNKEVCLKWLRFYWDFCHYNLYRTENLPPFLDKLREKWQSDRQRNQAQKAIAWFHHLQLCLVANPSVLGPSENLAALVRNPDTAPRSLVLSSNAISENATASTARSLILAQRDSKRPSYTDSYKQ